MANSADMSRSDQTKLLGSAATAGLAAAPLTGGLSMALPVGIGLGTQLIGGSMDAEDQAAAAKRAQAQQMQQQMQMQQAEMNNNMMMPSGNLGPLLDLGKQYQNMPPAGALSAY